MILHADGNSFYASCEQIYRPDLRNKPVVVLSNNDGVIIALNKEAKSCGLKRGDPYFKVREFCKIKGVAVFSSNYTLYADINRRITSIYLEFAPEIEEYSIDESFLFFEKCNLKLQEWYEIGHELKRRIFKEVGMPICVGVAPTKTLAKLYNKMAKKNNGVYVYESDKVDSILQETDCEDIWGIGRAKSIILKKHGITDALKLKNLPLSEAKRLMTVVGYGTVRELNAIPFIEKMERTQKEVITTSRQFSVKVYDLNTLECALVQYTELAVEKLRKQKCECGAVCVYISTCNYYATDKNEQYSNGAYMELARMTSYSPDIVLTARKMLHHLYRQGFGFKTVMVNLMKILPATYQGELWINPLEDIKKRDFMKSVDKITNDYGRASITLGKSFEKSGWEMRRNFLSPCWTTKYSDFPKVF